MSTMLNWKCVYCDALCFVIFLFRSVASGHETLTGKSNAVTYVESRDVVVSGGGTRWRRSTMSQQEMDAATSIHNTLRRREGASDMELMKWSSVLASMAQDWADGCDFIHGQPPRNPPPYAWIGQNLFYTTGTLNVSGAIENSWYGEKQYFNYDSVSCQANRVCGHYTQVVWAASRELGCGYRFCQNLRDSDRGREIGRATQLVCNYGPGGNYGGQKPFKKGKACSSCGGENKFCNEGLCNSNCAKPGPGCVCAITCFNCGSIVQDTCTCACPIGWHGGDCSTKCADMDNRCNNGWPPYFCNDTSSGATVRRSCPLMCKLCRAGNGTAPLTCSSPSPFHSNVDKSLFLTIASIAAMMSLTTWTTDFLS